ncbi:MAG: type IV toxin-antitoxin system AbiEi family antitoxin domain-containing protein [Solirubrobacterales bacterium]
MRKVLARPAGVVAGIAARQHGVVSAAQLSWAGLSPAAITRWAQAGRLHRLHRGVYAVGHSHVTVEGRWIGAVFACGEGAVLSHQSAAALGRISPRSPPLVHVTVPTYGGRARREGIRIHRSTTLTSADTARRRNIPVTAYARTLRDLGYGPEPTRSDLERLFLRLCRRHGIPKPEVNTRLGAHTVDFLWREAGLVVEVDGYRYHSDREAFESDRARDRDLKSRIDVLRFADRELATDGRAVARSLRAHLGRRLRGSV